MHFTLAKLASWNGHKWTSRQPGPNKPCFWSGLLPLRSHERCPETEPRRTGKSTKAKFGFPFLDSCCWAMLEAALFLFKVVGKADVPVQIEEGSFEILACANCFRRKKIGTSQSCWPAIPTPCSSWRQIPHVSLGPSGFNPMVYTHQTFCLLFVHYVYKWLSRNRSWTIQPDETQIEKELFDDAIPISALSWPEASVIKT